MFKCCSYFTGYSRHLFDFNNWRFYQPPFPCGELQLWLVDQSGEIPMLHIALFGFGFSYFCLAPFLFLFLFAVFSSIVNGKNMRFYIFSFLCFLCAYFEICLWVLQCITPHAFIFVFICFYWIVCETIIFYCHSISLNQQIALLILFRRVSSCSSLNLTALCIGVFKYFLY